MLALLRPVPTTVLAMAALLIGASGLSAQTTQYTACRVPDVGAIYMIGVPGTPPECLAEDHVEFSWSEGGQLADGSVVEAKLADQAVTAAKIADGSVTEAALADEAVTGAKVADGSLTGADLADGAVTGASIADGSILTADIDDGGVTASDIASSAVASAHIQNGTILREDLSAEVIPALGMAYVNGTQATPVLVRGRNAVSVVRRTGAPVGAYEITFQAPVNLATAYWSATTLGTGLKAGVVLASSTVLWVFVTNSDGTLTDASFFVTAF